MTNALSNRSVIGTLSLAALFAIAVIVTPLLVHGQVCGTDGYTETGSDPYNGGGCQNNDGSGGDGSYSVTVTANPDTIQSGQSTLVSWTTTGYVDGECTMATQYSTDGNSWTNQTNPVSISANGSKTDYPPYTTEYMVHCSHPYSYSQACGNTNCIVTTNIDRDGSAAVNVTAAPTLAASCSVNPTAITTGGSATWSATASGGTGTYTYSWSGTDNLSGTSASVAKTYSSAGTKSGSVTVTSGTQTITQACGNGLTVSDPTLTGSCSVSPTAANTGANVTWSATASGGTGTYTYSWSGTDGLAGSSASVAKAYTTAGTKTASVVLTSGSQSITQPCGNSLTVTAPVSSDLTAGSVSPSTATAGTPVTLSATISNGGTGSTNAGFTDLFQRATDSGGSNATDIGTYSNGTLAASGSNAASLSYTFPSSGTYYVRACADKSSAGNAGVIAESNEGNNCGPWSAVTVAAAVQPTPTCSLSASPSTVPSTLTWSSTNATSCTGGGFSTGNATSGSVSTSVSGAYTVTCTGTGGTCSASTNVGGAACTNPTLTLTGNPTRIKPGNTTTVTYSATGVSSCTITGPGAPAATPNSCSLPQNSFTSPALNQQTVYTLTCDGVSKTLIINVLPNIVEF